MGDVIRRPRPEPEELGLRVLYEDEWLIAVDKPPGMVVHPTYRNWSGTLLNGLLWHVRDRPGIRPSILTRLDKDTSGLVLAATTPEIQAIVQRDAAAGRLRKEYLALVRGAPAGATGTIALPLARSLEDRRIVVVSDAGQRCETRYEVIEEHGNRSLVRCELITGRTHQIRVHLAQQGWPILGDATYGVADPAIARQALHAWRIRLPHPITRQPLEIVSPWPSDLPSTRIHQPPSTNHQNDTL
jgi:23S rRNA pseudouridine1911/1915/1917 synthase